MSTGDRDLETTVGTSADAGVTARQLVHRLRAEGIEPGVVLDDHRLLVCVTELTRQPDIDRLADQLAAAVTPVLEEQPA